MKKFVVLLLLAGLGGGAWLATQPAAGLPAVQASDSAANAAKLKVATAFGTAAAAAFLTRHAQPIRVQLSDEELTSLAAEHLSGQVSNPIIHGTGGGVFDAAADTVWQGATLHVSGSGTVGIEAQGALHVVVQSANVGLLPLPGSFVQSLVDQQATSGSVPVPPGITNLALQPVDGGAVLTGTASPVR